MSTRPLGGTGLSVTALCIGTSPLADMPFLYGYSVSPDRAVATIDAVLAVPEKINFIDTSNGYGEDGAAERRVGTALRSHGGLPPGTVLATKVDPDPATGDFSGVRVLQSLLESMERLGLDHIDLLHLHDPERITFAEATLGADIEVPTTPASDAIDDASSEERIESKAAEADMRMWKLLPAARFVKSVQVSKPRFLP